MVKKILSFGFTIFILSYSYSLETFAYDLVYKKISGNQTIEILFEKVSDGVFKLAQRNIWGQPHPSDAFRFGFKLNQDEHHESDNWDLDFTPTRMPFIFSSDGNSLFLQDKIIGNRDRALRCWIDYDQKELCTISFLILPPFELTFERRVGFTRPYLGMRWLLCPYISLKQYVSYRVKLFEMSSDKKLSQPLLTARQDFWGKKYSRLMDFRYKLRGEKGHVNCRNKPDHLPECSRFMFP